MTDYKVGDYRVGIARDYDLPRSFDCKVVYQLVEVRKGRLKRRTERRWRVVASRYVSDVDDDWADFIIDIDRALHP